MRRFSLFVLAIATMSLVTGCCGSGFGPAPYGTAYNSGYQPQYAGPVASAGAGCNCR